MPTKWECEEMARADYRRVAGRYVEAMHVNGYPGQEDHTETFNGPFIVRINTTPDDCIARWVDRDHIDPTYNVTVVAGPRADIRAAWIYGPSVHPCGTFEDGDIIRVLSRLEALPYWLTAHLRINFSTTGEEAPR